MRQLFGFLFVILLIVLFILSFFFRNNLGQSIEDFWTIAIAIWPVTILGSLFFFGLLLANCVPDN
jgi:galactitol-specific phosphotransferase system IIC component